MKRFSTLFAAAAVFSTVQANAQYSQKFETDPALGGYGCIQTTDILWASKSNPSTKDLVIYGNGSAYGEPPVSGTAVRVFETPYLDLSSSTTISFVYQLTKTFNGGATRFISVGLINADGIYTKIDSFPLDPNYVKVVPKSYTINPADYGVTPTPATVAKVAIRLGGGNGAGSSRIVFDDLEVNANMHYGVNCNTAPLAVPNSYGRLNSDPFTANVITDVPGNDSDPENEGLVLTKITTPDPVTEGTITWNASGSFTFTPIANHPGGTILLTYTVTDNGYPRLSSTATITIEIPEPILTPMPVKLMSFAGSLTGNKANLKWSVADNETGDKFQVLRSADGKNFTEIATVFINGKVGAESYAFVDPRDLDIATYYKLKIINKDGSVSYSNIIHLKSATDKSSTGITILKNPVESTLTFTYTATTTSQGQVSIYNTVGVKVYSSRISSQKGTNAVSLNLDSHLAAGTYILEVVNGSERAVTRMIKQ